LYPSMCGHFANSRLANRSKRRVRYQDVLGVLLEMPLVWQNDVQQIIRDMRAAGEIVIENIGIRERTVKARQVLVLKNPK